MKTKNKDCPESSATKNDSTSLEDLHPYLVDFREFGHIAYELGQSKYADWFDGADEHDKRVKHADQLSRRALQFLQWENGSQENERVRVAVIGDFSSGKSSFINSLLGQDVCPVNVAASTSSITTFKYGDNEAIYLVGDSDKTDQPKRSPLERHEYEQLVTHQGQQEKKSGIRHEFEIYYPFDGFRDIELYDTPGFNNAENNQDEQITLEKCRNADVILFVFDINKGDLPADILNKVLRPLRQEKPEQPMIAIVNKADTKPPGKVEEIGNGIRSRNFFNQVLDYSSLDEMNAWKKTVVSASPESILESLKKTSPCKIEADENGFVLTPLSPKSARREPILQWMNEIRGQKATLIEAKRKTELNEYFKQGKVLLKDLQKSGKRKKSDDVNNQSTRERLLKTLPDNLKETLTKALSMALSSALTTEVILGSCSFWPDDWCVKFGRGKFEDKLRTIEFFKMKSIFNEFASAIPIESFHHVEQLCSELLSRFKNLVKLYKPLVEELKAKTLSEGKKCNHEEAAGVVSNQIREFGVNRGIEIFYEQHVDLVNQILDQLDIYDAKHAGSAEAHTQYAQIFNSRIKQFTEVFCSRNIYLIESECQ